MDKLPGQVLVLIVRFLPVRECSRLHRCSRRLFNDVRLPLDSKVVRLTFFWCKGRTAPPEVGLTLRSDHETYIYGYRANCDTLREGMKSLLMQPYISNVQLIVNYCVFDRHGINDQLLETFSEAPIIEELYMAYNAYETYELFCNVLNSIRARLYKIRTYSSSSVNIYVTRYCQAYPDVTIMTV